MTAHTVHDIPDRPGMAECSAGDTAVGPRASIVEHVGRKAATHVYSDPKLDEAHAYGFRDGAEFMRDRVTALERALRDAHIRPDKHQTTLDLCAIDACRAALTGSTE